MSGLSSLLNIAKSALLAQQSGMNVVSHNIANVNTEGYSKQEVQFINRPGLRTLNAGAGLGVDADHVRQRQAAFADKRIYNENSRLGQWDLTQRILEQTEIAFFGSGESDLNAMMNEFFNSWEDLSGNPESLEFRNQLLHKAGTLTDKFRELDSSLTEVRENIEVEFQAGIRKVNQLINQIDELNHNIERNEINSGSANDLRDQRGVLIKKLSSLIDIQVNETSTGVMRVSFKGHLLLSRNSKQLLSGNVSAGGSGNSGNSMTLRVGDEVVKSSHGQLGALLQLHGSVLPGYRNKLNDIADTLVKQVNTLHKHGFGLDGTTGENFFMETGTLAGTISLNRDLEKNPNMIATADGVHDYENDVHTSNGPGDNTIARRIADLRNVPLMNDKTSTLSDAYTDLYAQVGFDTAEAQKNTESHQGLLDQMENFRESRVGVSIDEEMADMLKFQNSYNAAARLISVADDMLKTLINVLG